VSRKQTKHPGRRLLTLLLAVVVGYSALAFGAATHRTTMTPGLALDLEGGTQIILTPTTTDGSAITDDMEDPKGGWKKAYEKLVAKGLDPLRATALIAKSDVLSLPYYFPEDDDVEEADEGEA